MAPRDAVSSQRPPPATDLGVAANGYRALVESAGDAIVLANQDGLITRFNPAAERTFGYSAEEAVGQPLTLLMPERFQEAHRAGLARYLATGEARVIGKTVELSARGKDGREFPIELTLSSWKDGAETFFTGILRDISDRKRAEQYFATERAVLEALTQSFGPEDAVPRLLEAIAEGTGWELGEIWTVEEPEHVLRCRGLWHTAAIDSPEFDTLSKEIAFAPGVGLPGRIWESGRPVWLEDVQQDANFPRLPAAVKNGLHGAIALPLTSGGEFVGVIEFFSRETRPPDEDFLAMLTAVGRQIGDFLKRSATEGALREAQGQLATIVEYADDALVGKTLEGIITSWNPGAERLYGYSADEAVGRPISMLVPDGREDEFPALLQRVARGETIARFDTVRRRKDGTEVDVSLTIAPTPDRQGKIVGAAVVARDVSERKRAERELAATAAELERSNAELEQFSSIVAHDLSEPLRVIAGFGDLLRDRHAGRLDDEGSRFLDAIGNSSDRMQRLIDDLLVYARVGRESERKPVDCRAVVDETLAGLARRCEETGATVEIGPLPTVEGDATQIGQLFQNLIGNALKFADAGPPRVHISADEEGAAWRFSVSDNGIGIDPKQAERIFEPFRRLHPREAYAGTGIGLAICKRIVQLHGGRIWVEAAPGGGSVFSFTLAG
jgi:two-component system, sensor histidine kinase and response regulator